MTAPIRDRIVNQLHYWIKPTTRFIASMIARYTEPLADEKDKYGLWDLEIIPKIRNIFKKFIETPVEVDNISFKVSNDREWLKPFLDMICLHLDAEGAISSARIELLKKLAKEEGLI